MRTGRKEIENKRKIMKNVKGREKEGLRKRKKMRKSKEGDKGRMSGYEGKRKGRIEKEEENVRVRREMGNE